MTRWTRISSKPRALKNIDLCRKLNETRNIEINLLAYTTKKKVVYRDKYRVGTGATDNKDVNII